MICRRTIVPVWVIVGLVFSGLVWAVGSGGAPSGSMAPAHLVATTGPPFGPTYAVTFTETGLPSGTSWAVTLNGSRVSSTTTTISFLETNGTFNYTVSNVPGWRAGAYTGSVSVLGGPASVAVTWSRTAYSVAFTESGLPTGTLWTVTLGGVLVSSTGSSLSFVEPNGTYNYSLSGVAGWRASAYSGTLTVNGASLAVTITWTQTTYSVTFTESGLPPGTLWAVTLGGLLGTASTNSISFAEPNGTYSYNVSNVLGWLANPSAGTVTVNGGPAPVMVTWTLVTYAVTFTETGLPSGTLWSVTLGGVPASSRTGSIAFAESNGSYAYAVGVLPGYSIAPASATITVSGLAVAAAVAFAAVSGSAYLVTFTESGLPSGTPWGATLGGSPATSSGASVGFDEPNGTLSYSIANVPGWRASSYSGTVTVSGAAASVRVSWVELAYAVTFSEVGLPSGTSWSVSLSGVLVSSGSSSITFAEPNGTYGYTISNGAGWRPNIHSGSITVNGGPAGVVVSWAQVAYPVTITESGLPTGDPWTVTLNGTTVSSTNASITYAEPNGTFSYTVTNIVGWHATPASGSVIVNGRAASASIAWSPVTYPLTFSEVGLPSGTSWSVMVGATRGGSTNDSIAFSEPNGTFNYTVSNVPGWRASAYAGSVTVSAKPATVALTWTPAAYTVTFTESGLPSGTSWSVTLGGVLGASTTGSLSFPEPNGTFAYRVTSISGWRESPSSGSVTISGGSASVAVVWADVTYSVTFSESGLPSGTAWTVLLGGNTRTANTTSITMAEPNGTFDYNLSSPSGWKAATAAGVVTVSGGPLSLATTWSAVTYSVTFEESGLPIATTWGVSLNATLHSSNTTSVGFDVSNGTLAYIVGGLPGWTPTPRTGSITVNGKATSVAVSWARTTYTVTFTEIGLTPGTYWGVTLGGTQGTSTSSSIPIPEPNGTFAYSVAAISGWHANAYAGSVTVAGKPASLSVVWNEMAYPVTFAETGLPAGTTWSISLGGGVVSSATALIVVQLANGTVPYGVLGVPGWRASSYSGSFTVNGQPASVTVTWGQLTYPVTFSESGLPAGTSWGVTLGGLLSTSTGPSITFTEPNGTFPFLLSAVSGWSTANGSGSVSVSGWPAGITVAWSEMTYSVTFAESGLPSGTSWSVTLGGALLTTPERSIAFIEPNGTFGYTITGVPGWQTGARSGSVTIDGSPVVVTVDWAKATYPVIVTESGLPSGTSWSVTLSGTVMTSTDASITILEPNGTYNFSLAGIPGWHAKFYVGSVTVAGGPAGVAAAWSQVTYLITFTETGLPAGTPWTVTIGGTAASSTNATISISEPNGSYTYTIGGGAGYTFSPSSGPVVVTLNPVALPVAFHPVSKGSTFLGVTGTYGMAWIATAIGAILAALVLLLLWIRARNAGAGPGTEENPAALEEPESPGGDETGVDAEPAPGEPDRPPEEPGIAPEEGSVNPDVGNDAQPAIDPPPNGEGP